ncbi:MAG TPA: hypothetical protein VFV00_10865 [Acidimicrobiales bacterium]|nr:hypothetical protein [Acidimicrobiales bacterium]
MGEKGNLADGRPTGGHVPVASPPPPPPASGGGGGGGLLSDLADQAKDKVTDVGLGGEGLGIVHRDRDDDEST